MKINKAFKFRIYPNQEQQKLINQTFGCVRFVYNTYLAKSNKLYEIVELIMIEILMLILIF